MEAMLTPIREECQATCRSSALNVPLSITQSHINVSGQGPGSGSCYRELGEWSDWSLIPLHKHVV